MYGRIYYVSFEHLNVTAAMDLFYLQAAVDKPIIIHKAIVTLDDDETNQQIRFKTMRRASVSVGSGGASATIDKRNSHDSAAGFTARVGDTSRATGTASPLDVQGNPAQGGYEYLPDVTERPPLYNGEGFILGVEVAPNPTVYMSGTLTVEEL